MPEHRRAQIRDDALAQRHDEVVAAARGEREHADDKDHRTEIAINRAGALRRKAVVDHQPHSDRHDQRRRGGDRQRHQRGGDPALIAGDIGSQRQQEFWGVALFRAVGDRGGIG